MKVLKLLILLLFTISSFQLFSQEDFPNTMFYDSISGSPKATIEEISWLAGHWQGNAFGGIVEEIWAPPMGGSMMGAFKLVADNNVQFYEIETISEENESLILRLKHFNADLKGWEEKDKTVDFKLVKITQTKAFFDGFTIEYINDNAISMYVIIDYEGVKEEMKFEYKRVN
jgi:hypothetical protein